MYKVVWLMKRKQGWTHEAFREHFERSHAPMALRHAGHLFVEYRRNYASQVWSGGDPREGDSGFRARDWQWDLMSEWITASEEDFHEILRIMEQPHIRREFEEDEDRFIDRTATVMIPFTVATSLIEGGRKPPA